MALLLLKQGRTGEALDQLRHSINIDEKVGHRAEARLSQSILDSWADSETGPITPWAALALDPLVEKPSAKQVEAASVDPQEELEVDVD